LFASKAPWLGILKFRQSETQFMTIVHLSGSLIQVAALQPTSLSVDGTFDLAGWQGFDYILHANKYAGLARVSCSKNLLIPAREPLPEPVQLSLTITGANRIDVLVIDDWAMAPMSEAERRDLPKIATRHAP
jgi:hypothetical protein